jgi:hypothetical protein
MCAVGNLMDAAENGQAVMSNSVPCSELSAILNSDGTLYTKIMRITALVHAAEQPQPFKSTETEKV